MTTETTVTRFVDKKDLDFPPPTLVKANEEEDDYVWQRAGNGHYACKHDDTAHTIIEKDGTIGCSCGDWTHRCKGVEGCKHVAAFLHRKNPPAAKLDKRIAMDLIAAGWKKTEHGNLYPPDHESTAEAREQDVEAAMGAGWQKGHPEPEVVAELPPIIPLDPDLDIGDDPLPEPEQISVTCQYCKMGAMRAGQARADAWLREHEAKCAKNPANKATSDPDGTDNEGEDPTPEKPPIPKPGLMSANCQYCGKAIKRKLAADLKLALEIHEESCTERPKEQKPGVKKMTPEFPEIPEEEKKMEENTTEMKNEEKTAWNEDAWNGATQGNFATYNEAGIAEVLFTANDFEIGKPDKWGRTPYEFAVIQNTKSVILSVAAIRLMYALKRMLPLEGKRINIIRTGSGMDTQYEVQEVAI